MEIRKSLASFDTCINSFSKSITNRALILAALNPKQVTVFNPSDSEDSLYLIKALEKIGIIIRENDDSLVIENCIYDLNLNEQITVFVGEGGTTIRFFLFLISMIDCEINLETTPEFLSRPIDDYLELLKGAGVDVSIKDNFIVKKAKVQAEKLNIDCSKTTQFASAAILCLGAAKVDVSNIKASMKYLDITLKMDKERLAEKFIVPIDMSSLSYLIAYNKCIAPINITNFTEFDPDQADSYLQVILKELESHNKLQVDISNCLDLAPTLAFIFSYTDGIFTLTNIENLKFKESNRLEAIMYLLDSFNIEYIAKDSELIIYGKESTMSESIELKVTPDHRMVMSAVLFLLKNNGGVINNTESVAKSYPSFFKDLKII